MKKHLLLFFALLASSVGGWAQAPFNFTNWVYNSFTRIGGTDGDASYVFNFPLCLEQKGIKVTNEGDLTVTFTWNGGSWRMEFYGVDLVDESTGNVAYSKYEHKYAGGDGQGQVYTITGVTPGTYTIRYWSSKFGHGNNDPIGGSGGSTGTIAHSGVASTGISFTKTSWDGKEKAEDWKRIPAPTVVTDLIKDKGWGRSYNNIHYYNDENLVFSNAAFYNINYNYTGADGDGNEQLNLRGVEVLDNNGKLVYCDYHEGFTGTNANNRDYKIRIPSAGTYTVRTLVQTGSAGNVKSKGNITYTEINEKFINSFIRIKDAGNKYMTCVNSNNKTVFSATEDAKSIYFYTGSALISLYNGFLASRYGNGGGFPCGMNAPTAESEGTLYYIHNSPSAVGKYVISFGGDTRFMFKGANAGTYSGPSAATDPGYQFTIEQLTSLPIAINAYGFASVNLPVAIELGDNTTAWYASVVNDSEVTLTKITGTLPANTPAILINKNEKEQEVSYTIATSEATGLAEGTNKFNGTTAAKTTTSGSNYVLSGDGIKKFTGTTLKGFRAYLPVAQGQNIRSMVFEGEDVVTAIEAAEGAVPADGKAYDLNGRSVVRANGVVIVNGKTIAIK